MITLSEAKFLMFNTYFCDKNGLLPFNFGFVAKIKNLLLSAFFLLTKFSVGFHIETEWARNMNMSFQSKIMIIKNSQITRDNSGYNL